jgi:hypothetical protein
MLASLPAMSQPVTIPIFASSAQHTQQQDGGSEWFTMDDGDQDMDFDLLAEYLLEENPTVNNRTEFDFK